MDSMNDESVPKPDCMNVGEIDDRRGSQNADFPRDEKGSVAELVGIEGGVVSGVFNLESSDVGASDRRPRHEENYHEV